MYPEDYTQSINPVQITINSTNQCGIKNHFGLNDANKQYIFIKKTRSTMAQKATIIYYKSLPNRPTKNKHNYTIFFFQHFK